MPDRGVNLKKIKTYPISKRLNKVKKEDFARLSNRGGDFSEFLDSLPNILAANEFRRLVDSIIEAKRKSKPVVFMMGAHIIKCGLSPIIIELMERGVITAIALSGAGSIHDFEVALIGETSEDVTRGLEDGSFGMARETAQFINSAIKNGLKKGWGAGRSIGGMILKKSLPFGRLSILAAGVRLGVPVTVHIAVGTDVIHQHPSCDGKALGEGSLRDFHTFISIVSNLGGGGVAVNMGSAVILPEVFLKALAVARNLGYKVKNFTTANLDMIFQYRPQQNVVLRPTLSGGEGYTIIGHHEIMVPLLYRAIIERI